MWPLHPRDWAVHAACALAETDPGRRVLGGVMKRTLGIHRLARLVDPLWLTLQDPPLRARDARPHGDAPVETASLPAWPSPVSAYTRAYARGECTPRQVLERALAALDALGRRWPSMDIVAVRDDAAALDAADAASRRYAEGQCRGPLDGIPVLIKDQYDVRGLPTRLGTRWAAADAERDATVVARLRRAGAVVLCKTVLTELGLSPVGVDTHRSLPRNAHHTAFIPGGSSTGVAVGVALGVAPLGLAGDGGGSIRIPASLNGIFGLKPTFGRVSGAGDRFQMSMAHPGPMGAHVSDLAVFLDAVASEPDPEDVLTAWAPRPPPGGFGAALGAGVRGLRIGVDTRAWREAPGAVVRPCEQALRALEREGARRVDVRTSLAPHAPAMGYVLLGREALASASRWGEGRVLGDETRLALSVFASLTEEEYVDALRLRSALRRETAGLLRQVDLLALPTLGTTAPRVSRAVPGALGLTAALCRYCLLANLTGLPAGTAPVGVDDQGLPVGMQLIGDAWDEACVLGGLAHLERLGVARPLRPQGAVGLLSE